MKDRNLPDRTQGSQTVAKMGDLDAMKSLYYWLNAKPDTQIKVFHESRRVSFTDIKNLNDKIQTKLNNHDTFTNITSINVIFEKGDIKSFGAWEEFLRTDWTVPQKTKSVAITWDINIKLPNYELPQRHTVKARIGSSIKPAELFQLVTNGDSDVALREAVSFLVAKVDFVNGVISSEIIQIITDWYQCLSLTEETSGFQTFVTKQKGNIARLTHYLVPISLLTILYVVFKYNTMATTQFQFNNKFVVDVYFWFLVTIVTYFVSNYLGGLSGNRIFRKIHDYKDETIFELTRADKNSIEETRTKNLKISTSIKTQIILMIVGTIISIALTEIIEQFLKSVK